MQPTLLMIGITSRTKLILEAVIVWTVTGTSACSPRSSTRMRDSPSFSPETKPSLSIRMRSSRAVSFALRERSIWLPSASRAEMRSLRESVGPVRTSLVG